MCFFNVCILNFIFYIFVMSTNIVAKRKNPFTFDPLKINSYYKQDIIFTDEEIERFFKASELGIDRLKEYQLNTGIAFRVRSSTGENILSHILKSKTLDEFKKYKLIEFLIEQNVPVDILDNTNAIPLHYACKYHYQDIILLLTKHSANINHQNFQLHTPLHSYLLTETKKPFIFNELNKNDSSIYEKLVVQILQTTDFYALLQIMHNYFIDSFQFDKFYKKPEIIQFKRNILQAQIDKITLRDEISKSTQPILSEIEQALSIKSDIILDPNNTWSPVALTSLPLMKISTENIIKQEIININVNLHNLQNEIPNPSLFQNNKIVENASIFLYNIKNLDEICKKLVGSIFINILYFYTIFNFRNYIVDLDADCTIEYNVIRNDIIYNNTLLLDLPRDTEENISKLSSENKEDKKDKKIDKIKLPLYLNLATAPYKYFINIGKNFYVSAKSDAHYDANEASYKRAVRAAHIPIYVHNKFFDNVVRHYYIQIKDNVNRIKFNLTTLFNVYQDQHSTLFILFVLVPIIYISILNICINLIFIKHVFNIILDENIIKKKYFHALLGLPEEFFLKETFIKINKILEDDSQYNEIYTYCKNTIDLIMKIQQLLYNKNALLYLGYRLYRDARKIDNYLCNLESYEYDLIPPTFNEFYNKFTQQLHNIFTNVNIVDNIHKIKDMCFELYIPEKLQKIILFTNLNLATLFNTGTYNFVPLGMSNRDATGTSELLQLSLYSYVHALSYSEIPNNKVYHFPTYNLFTNSYLVPFPQEFNYPNPSIPQNKTNYSTLTVASNAFARTEPITADVLNCVHIPHSSTKLIYEIIKTYIIQELLCIIANVLYKENIKQCLLSNNIPPIIIDNINKLFEQHQQLVGEKISISDLIPNFLIIVGNTSSNIIKTYLSESVNYIIKNYFKIIFEKNPVNIDKITVNFNLNINNDFLKNKLANFIVSKQTDDIVTNIENYENCILQCDTPYIFSRVFNNNILDNLIDGYNFMICDEKDKLPIYYCIDSCAMENYVKLITYYKQDFETINKIKFYIYQKLVDIQKNIESSCKFLYQTIDLDNQYNLNNIFKIFMSILDHFIYIKIHDYNKLWIFENLEEFEKLDINKITNETSPLIFKIYAFKKKVVLGSPNDTIKIADSYRKELKRLKSFGTDKNREKQITDKLNKLIYTMTIQKTKEYLFNFMKILPFNYNVWDEIFSIFLKRFTFDTDLNMCSSEMYYHMLNRDLKESRYTPNINFLNFIKLSDYNTFAPSMQNKALSDFYNYLEYLIFQSQYTLFDITHEVSYYTFQTIIHLVRSCVIPIFDRNLFILVMKYSLNPDTNFIYDKIYSFDQSSIKFYLYNVLPELFVKDTLNLSKKDIDAESFEKQFSQIILQKIQSSTYATFKHEQEFITKLNTLSESFLIFTKKLIIELFKFSLQYLNQIVCISRLLKFISLAH